MIQITILLSVCVVLITTQNTNKQFLYPSLRSSTERLNTPISTIVKQNKNSNPGKYVPDKTGKYKPDPSGYYDPSDRLAGLYDPTDRLKGTYNHTDRLKGYYDKENHFIPYSAFSKGFDSNDGNINSNTENGNSKESVNKINFDEVYETVLNMDRIINNQLKIFSESKSYENLTNQIQSDLNNSQEVNSTNQINQGINKSNQANPNSFNQANQGNIENEDTNSNNETNQSVNQENNPIDEGTKQENSNNQAYHNYYKINLSSLRNQVEGNINLAGKISGKGFTTSKYGDTASASDSDPIKVGGVYNGEKLKNLFANNEWGILQYAFTIFQDGYHYLYSTSNGINAEEEGHLEYKGTDQEGLRAQGYFSYIGPDSVTYTVRYIADRNGFQPEGDHIPKIPELIQKSLDYKRSLGII